MAGIKSKVLGIAILASFLLGTAAMSDETATAGKQVVAKWQNSVIYVKVVAKMSMSYDGEEEQSEETAEAIGCIIDPSGLVVTTLKETDPSAMFQDYMDESDGKLSVSVDITDLKYIMPDGKEIPAKIVLRDKELDLAFFRPVKKPDAPMASLDLSKAGKPGLFDQMISLNRQGIAANRAISVSLDRIETILEKPRLLYIPDFGDALGSPAFTMDGSLIGIAVTKTLPSGSTSDTWNNEAWVILPIADIAEAAKQAPATADAVKDAPK